LFQKKQQQKPTFDIKKGQKKQKTI